MPKAVVQERYERLVQLVDDIAWDENKKLVGRTVELLVAEGEGRKDEATHRLTGRARDNRLVHFEAPVEPPASRRPGRGGRHLRRAAPPGLRRRCVSVRRTRSGDAWEARQGKPADDPSGTMLGLPTVGVPAPLPPAPACASP